MISLIVEKPVAKLWTNRLQLLFARSSVDLRARGDSRRLETAPVVPNVIPRHFLSGHFVRQRVKHFADVLISDGRVVLQRVTEKPMRTTGYISFVRHFSIVPATFDRVFGNAKHESPGYRTRTSDYFVSSDQSSSAPVFRYG